MNKKEIPQEVIKMARDEGYNSVGFVCYYKGAMVFSCGIKDKDGMLVPIGLPKYLLYQNNQVRRANDIERDELMGRR